MDLLTLARHVGIFNRQTQAYITAAFSSVDVSFSECIFLMNIYGHEGINQEELSSRLYIDKAATARAIKSLEKNGFITRETMPDDRRVKRLYLTDKAIEHKEHFYLLMEKWEKHTTQGLDEETKDLLFKGIQVLANNSTKGVNEHGIKSEAD